MKRFVWGVVLMVLGVLSFIGANGADKDDAISGGFMFLIAGAILTYYGNKYKNELKQTSEFALQMIRDDGKIDARELAQRVGVSEVDIRMYIAESQKKGVIPFKADIL
ncbi:MAG: hypothetical protein HQL49_13605 [Gammaproteobacteria bacterium]|nr:hypothetical protein [Gammaproteobacteria bacterium]